MSGEATVNVILVGKNRLLDRLFSASGFRSAPTAELEGLLANPSADNIVYLDAGSFTRKSWEETIPRMSAEPRINWAVIDHGQLLPDPAAVFHAGALDYAGRDAPDGFIDDKRIDTIMRFAEGRLQTDRPANSRHQNQRQRQTAFSGWDQLVEGKEYEFLMLFIGLCDADGLHTRLGDTRFAKLKSSVVSVAETLASERDGVVWISDGQCILELFKPDSASKVVTSCIRILANMELVSYEQLRLDQETVSLNFSLCRATAPWQKPGNTGTIVADSINYIYHLGRKFTPPGVIDLVDDLASSLPSRLADHIVPAGSFEGKTVNRFAGFFHPEHS
jgi:hypothetical protein